MTVSTEINEKFRASVLFLQDELKKIKTSRAMPSLVEDINVDAYGAKTPLSQLASITCQGSQVLNIQPWDQGVTKEIEKSLSESQIGVNPVVDGTMIRLNFPPLTEEKRIEIVKVLSERLEAAKVSIRKIREEYIRVIKEEEKNGDISEDDYFATEKELQKMVDEFNGQVKEIGEHKEKEIMTV